MKYFSYCPEDGFDTHETLEDALLNANGIIPNYLDDGWSEDVTGVFVGTITHAATMCDKVERAGEVDEHGYDEDGEHWDQGWEYKCDYKMLPVKQNPAPDVSMLVEALERIKDMDSMAYHCLETAKIVARNALTTYRKQEGSK